MLCHPSFSSQHTSTAFWDIFIRRCAALWVFLFSSCGENRVRHTQKLRAKDASVSWWIVCYIDNCLLLEDPNCHRNTQKHSNAQRECVCAPNISLSSCINISLVRLVCRLLLNPHAGASWIIILIILESKHTSIKDLQSCYEFRCAVRHL